MTNAKAPIVVEETYESHLPDVWQAITDPEQMRQWFFPSMTDFRPEVGFRTSFVVDCDGKAYEHVWEVLDVDPESKLVYRWQYGGYPGDSTVTWELKKQTSGTNLTLTHDGHHTFPQNDPAFQSDSCQAGWNWFIHDSLKNYLNRGGSG